MKRTILIVLAVIMMISVQTGTLAEGGLSADYDNGTLHVQWTPGSEGVLTVYRAGWPISVCTVPASADSSSIYVGSSDKLSVCLKNAFGCQKLNVNGNAPVATATPSVTATPAPAATPVPTVRPTASPMVTAPVSVGGQSMTSMAAQVISEVNAERAKYGLSPLTMSAELTRAACVRAQEIVEKFSHTRPDGSSWSTVSSAAFGENIAKGQRSADHVMAAWMSSEGHRANILRASYGSIGVCALKVNGVIYWVQLFGK